MRGTLGYGVWADFLPIAQSVVRFQVEQSIGVHLFGLHVGDQNSAGLVFLPTPKQFVTVTTTFQPGGTPVP